MGASILDDCGQAANRLLARLESPERNHYFYGKLLDAWHLELEQRYGNNKRWLINRLTLGSGVLKGLRVEVSPDGSRVRVGEGVAIDGLGREIIVPVTSPHIDPRQPTDECGRASGLPIKGMEEVTLSICYLECEAEPVAAVVDPCGDGDECEHGLVRERYRLSITRGRPRNPSTVTMEQCSAIFSQPPDNTSRRVVACRTLDDDKQPEEVCVPLATLQFDDNGRVITSVQQCEARRMIYSNSVLLDLIFCLARRVDECCGAVSVRSLTIVDGDNQTAPVGTAVAKPLLVRVVDGGNPVDNENVTFDVVPGGGEIGTSGSLSQSFTTTTNAQGLATCNVWQLGTTTGPQRVTARIASGSPSMVTFLAIGTKSQVVLPVVRRQWPTPAIHLDLKSPDPINVKWYENFLKSPRIELSFNVQMEQSQLKQLTKWLRVSLVQNFGQNEILVTPIAVQYAGPAAQPIIGMPGEFTEIFSLRSLKPGELGRAETRVLVQIRAAGGNIVDVSTPPRLLDAEYLLGSTGLARRTEIFELADPKTFPTAVWTSLVNTGAALPQSGDGVEGGEFFSWFATEQFS